MIVRTCILFIFSLAVAYSASGQEALCDSTVPVFEVDLSAHPTGIYLSPDIRREGLCCDNYWPDRCVEFIITLHPSAVGIVFDIEVGAEPPGALFYTINCGPEIPVGELACIEGNGPHYLTFCKPGANRNIYSVQSIPGRLMPDTALVVEGCVVDLGVDGLVESTIEWTDITSGNGSYEDLLSCMAGCDSSTFTSTTELPEYIQYSVCGYLQNPICDMDTFACDTVTVHVLQDIEVEIVIDDNPECSGLESLMLEAVISGGSDMPLYQWYMINNGNYVTLGNEAQQLANQTATYGVIVGDAMFPECRHDTTDIEILIGSVPDLQTPGDLSICGEEELTFTATGAPVINWFSSSGELCMDCQEMTGIFETGQWIYVQGVDGGCEQLDSFFVDVRPEYEIFRTDSICEGFVHELPDGSEVSASGTYEVILPTAAGCDSVIITSLIVMPSMTMTVYDTICAGEVYILPDGTELNASGMSTDTAFTNSGCDSIVQVLLTVLPVYETVINERLCGEEDYTLPDGSVVSNAGEFTFSFQSSAGCDSTVTIIIEAFPEYDIVIIDTVCDAIPYILPDGSIAPSSGTYQHQFNTASGCDSTITTNLMMAPSTVFVIEDTICAGDEYILPDGSVFNFTGRRSDTLYSSFGCDSVVQTLLTVFPVYYDTAHVELCAFESYILPGGAEVTSAGTYTDYFSSSTDCDSVKVTVVELLEVSVNFTDVEACEGTEYTLPSGLAASESGMYISIFTAFNGCDSLETTILEMIPAFEDTIQALICDGGSYTLPDGTEAAGTGTWVHSFSSHGGCDSTITTIVTQTPSYDVETQVTICAGETYLLPGGMEVQEAGTYIDTMYAFSGFDSIVRTNIHVLPEYTQSVQAFICDSEPYVLPDGTVTVQPGQYTHSYSTSTACDSTIYTNLETGVEHSIFITDTICDVETYILPDGSDADASGTYIHTLTGQTGCDSVITTSLSILPSGILTILDTICEGESYTLPDGSVITTSGEVVEIFRTAFGCDAVIQTILTILPEFHDTVRAFICSGDVYTLPDGSVTGMTGTYVHSWDNALGCDSVITTIIETAVGPGSIQNFSICAGQSVELPDGDEVYFSGIYSDTLAAFDGCDSIVTTIIDISPSIAIPVEAVICEGDEYALPDGSIVYAGTEQADTFYTGSGCDSLIRTILNIIPSEDRVDNVALCEGEGYQLPGGEMAFEAGTYVDILTSSAGCDSVITTEISLNGNNASALQAVVCEGSAYILPDGTPTEESGSYQTMLLSSTGCDSTVIVNLEVVEQYEQTVRYSICHGETLLIPDISEVTVDTLISVILVSSTGCDSIVTYEVEVEENYSIHIDTTVCGTGLEMFGQFFDEEGEHLLQFLSQAGCDSSTLIDLRFGTSYVSVIDTTLCTGTDLYIAGHTFGEQGQHTIVYEGSSGCDSIFVIDLYYTDPPYVTVREDTTIVQGSEVEAYIVRQSPGPLACTWYVNDSMAARNVFRFTRQYMQASMIRVEVTDPYECAAADQFRIDISEKCPDDLIFAPNIISPNHDGANDVFDIRNPHDVIIREVAIFNRWGELVYEAPDFSIPWDGTFRGRICNPDVYTYYIKGSCVAGDLLLKKGNITLIK